MTRIDPPGAGDERETLLAFLDYHRATLLMKCDGLTPAQLMIAACPPSKLTLLGLVRHLAEVERGWFQTGVAALELPSLFGVDDADFNLPDGDPQTMADEAFRLYREEVAGANEVMAGVADLGQTFATHHGPLSVRWLLAHMIEEYARHNGHADLIREAIDGATGE